MAADNTDDHCKDRCLDHADEKVADIGPFEKPCLEHHRRYAQIDPCHQRAPQKPHEVRDQPEDRQHQKQRQNTRQEQHRRRVKAERPHRVDLFAHLHRPDGGGKGGCGAPRDDDRGQQDPQLAQDRNGDQVHDKDLGPELAQLGRALERKNHADEKGHQRHDRNGPQAHILAMGDQRGQAERARVTQGAKQAVHDDAQIARQFEKEANARTDRSAKRIEPRPDRPVRPGWRGRIRHRVAHGFDDGLHIGTCIHDPELSAVLRELSFQRAKQPAPCGVHPRHIPQIKVNSTFGLHRQQAGQKRGDRLDGHPPAQARDHFVGIGLV